MADELGLFLFTYEIHPSLTPDTICPDVNSFQINAEGYEDKLLKTLKPKYNRLVLFDAKKFLHGMQICNDVYLKDSFRMNQVMFFKSYKLYA